MARTAPVWPWRLAAWAAGLLPALWLGWCVWRGDLGANPVETLEHESGLRALQLLLLTLAMTPLHRYVRGTLGAIKVRRTLGLWAYAWVCAHFACYLVFDLQFSAAQLGDDLVKRTYITLGFTAWLLLLPLAVTSTQGWQRRLKRNWKRLHRLVYPATALASAHFLWLVKKDLSEPAVYAGLLVLLLALRLPAPEAFRRSGARQPL